jgi:hypothetical protein
MKLWAILWMFCMVFIAKAQTYRFKISDPIVVIDYNNNAVIAIEDSAYQVQISLKTKKVVKKSLYWDKQLSFNQLRTEFIPLSENGSPIYFIERGCGWVCELRNDSIVRIDQSFHHQSQYGGAYFMHKGAPHIFGGYGIFTFKGIMTRYDSRTNQWAKVSEVDSPYFFFSNVYHKRGSKLFTQCSRDETTPWKNNAFFCYDITGNKWKNLGYSLLFDTIGNHSQIKITGNYIIKDDVLYEIKPDLNRLVVYKFKTNNSCSAVYEINQFKITVSLVHNFQNDSYFSLLDIYEDKIFQQKYFLKEGTLFETAKPKVEWTFTTIILLLLLVLSALYFLNNWRKKRTLKTADLSDNVKLLLQLWMNKADGNLELNEINDFVSYDNPSIDTLKKRRENFLKTFNDEITSYYGFRSESVYTTAINPLDKRMKILVLNPKLIAKIKKGN